MKRKILLIISFIVCYLTISAQELKVHSFVESFDDLSAKELSQEDANGDKCALVKVFIAVKETHFEGNVIREEVKSDNEYWVYMPKGSRCLVVKAPSYYKLQIEFSNWNISSLKEELTYCLKLETVSILPPEEKWDTPVDLGLSVQWAACNIGASSPEQYGNYYTWNKTDDAINTLADNWRMPTVKELQELKEKCTWKVEFLKRIRGYRVIGPNGNSIFLPFAGEMVDESCVKLGKECFYMSSGLSNKNNEFVMGISVSEGGGNFYYNIDFTECQNGCSIRPVCNK